jgi:choline dehydrogenase
VDIASNDTEVNPIIDPGWFSNPGDIEVAVAGFRRSRALMATRAMAGITLGGESYPGADVQTDDEIVEWLREASNTVHHACCTASMGPRDNPDSVVDTQGRVIGVSGIRVVDASIMPFLTPGHPISIICKFLYASVAGILTLTLFSRWSSRENCRLDSC